MDETYDGYCGECLNAGIKLYGKRNGEPVKAGEPCSCEDNPWTQTP